MTSPIIPLWPDNPTSEDLLGFRDIALPVVDVLKRDRLDPVALGVFGDWGSGKTTVLELIREELKDDGSIVVVYTRPWEYDPATDPKATLIAEVLKAVRKAAADEKGGFEKLSASVKDKFINLTKRIKWSKAIALAGNTAISLTPPNFNDVVDIFGKEDDSTKEPTLQGFREEFHELMKELDAISRVVVIVDDLDRCLPTSVIGALEAIKLFLSVEKMAFVLAADKRLVTHAIATRYAPSPQADLMAQQYLEKIVQIPIGVPALGEGDTEAYIGILLLHRHLEDDPVKLSKIVEHCSAMRHDSRSRVLEDLPDDLLPVEGPTDLALAAQLAPVLTNRLSGNPRRIKRFMNALWIRDDIARRRKADLEMPALAKLLLLEELEEDKFNQLLTWLSEGVLPEKLAEAEGAKSDSDLPDDLKTFYGWAKSGPALAQKGLGSYLRLAASLRHKVAPTSDLKSELQEKLDELLSDTATARKSARDSLSALQPDDQLALSRELVGLLRRDPDRQDHVSPALAVLAQNQAVAEDLADRLRDIDPAQIKPRLVIDLRPISQLRPVISSWLDSGKLDAMTQNAAKMGLKEG